MMDSTKQLHSPTKEIFQEGLTDLYCSTRQLASDPSKKAVKVLSTRINPERAASRALMFCGTNYQLA